jgi:hypothetical protein
MEIEELVKRLEWLDSERRKDKQLIIDLTGQVEDLTQKIISQRSTIKDLESAIKRTSQSIVKAEVVEESISKQKVEFSEQLAVTEKKLSTLEKKIDKTRKDDADSVTKKLIDFQNEIKPMAEFRKTIQDRSDHEYRVNQKIEDYSKTLQGIAQNQEEEKRLVALLDDSQKIDSKRISDLQVELNVLRKRIEDARNSADVQAERAKKIDTRLNDLENQEQLRKQEQVSFIESQSRSTVEFEKKWKEWETKFSTLDDLRIKLQNQILEFDTSHRAVKQSLVEFDEVNTKLDRRINEITEVNRLTEDRFRQEWVSFKGDDQKRWTNYALTQEEQNRERDREISRLTDLFATIEERVQQILDSVSIMNEETEKRIKGLLALSNEFLSSFEKSSGKRK